MPCLASPCLSSRPLSTGPGSWPLAWVGLWLRHQLQRRRIPMSRRYVKQLTDGDSLDDVYLVGDKQMRANRNGNPYLQVELRDRSGSIGARMWNATDNVI